MGEGGGGGGEEGRGGCVCEEGYFSCFPSACLEGFGGDVDVSDEGRRRERRRRRRRRRKRGESMFRRKRLNT